MGRLINISFFWAIAAVNAEGPFDLSALTNNFTVFPVTHFFPGIREWEDLTLSLYENITKVLNDYHPKTSLLTSVAEHDLQFASAPSPFVTAACNLVEKGCAASVKTKMAEKEMGDAAVELFPSCLTDVMKTDKAAMKEFGMALRTMLNSTEEVEQVFNLEDGVCLPVAQIFELDQLLNFGDAELKAPVVCDQLREIARFSVKLVQESDRLADEEEEEDEEDEEPANSMLQVKISLHLRNDIETQLKVAQRRLLIRKAWEGLALKVMKVEAVYMLREFEVDEANKWRYTAGLAQFFTFLNCFLQQLKNA